MLPSAHNARTGLAWVVGSSDFLEEIARFCYGLTVHRAFKFRLYPSPDQEQTLRQFAGTVRFVYNLALEQRRTFWRQYRAATGNGFNFASQGREVTTLRAECAWIAETPADFLHQALRDLDRAYSSFFRGQGGYPTPRKRGCNDSFRCPGAKCRIRQVNRRWGEIRVPKIGLVRYRLTRPIQGKVESATVSWDGIAWHVSISCVIDHEAPANDNPSIGIDRGITQTLALSSGEAMALPDLRTIDRRVHRARRKLARCQRGSNRRAKRKAALRKLTSKVARTRRDWQHRASTEIARRFGTVVLEDLKIVNMTARGRGKRGLNRSILNQGWGAFATMLAYKLEERGGTLIKVNPAFTSQQCSACGTIDRQSRESQASFVCTSCGFALNADHNAAINIARRSTSGLPAEGSGYAPDEPGTSRMAA